MLLFFSLLGLAGCAGAPTGGGNAAVLVTAQANPAGGFEKVLALQGDATLGPLTAVRTASGVTASSASTLPGSGASLRIIYFNDLHNALTLPNATRGDTHVFSQIVKRVEDARRAAPPSEVVLFLSAGDDHTGSVFDELVGGDEASFVLDPAYRSYARGGLDATVIGNHELDRGARVLAKAIRADARFPVLSANLAGSKVLTQPLVFPAIIGISKGVRVAVIGVTTPDETVIRAGDDPGLRFQDPVATLSNLIPALEGYADVFVILSHVGFNVSGAGARHEVHVGDVDIARAAAKVTRKPVVLVGGHTHTILNRDGLDPQNIVDGIPVLQAGGQGQYYGEILFHLSASKGAVTAKAAESRLVPIKRRDDRVKEGDAKYASLEHDSDYNATFEAAVISPILASLKTKLTERIGASDPQPDNSTARTFADRYTGECAIANFMNDAVVARSGSFPGGKVDIAVFNASGVAAGVPAASALTFNDMYAMMPYADVVFIAELTGAQLKEMVRSNAKRLVRPEELQGMKPLDTAAYISRGFLHFSRALRYTIRLGATAAEADAIDIAVNGAPIEGQIDKNFRVAFSSYIAGGGEGWSGKPVGAGLPESIVGYDIRSIPKLDTGLIYRNEIVAFLRATGTLGAETGAAKDGRIQARP
jgi:2',3'-cyclic-nucleotide 2'-phosphodiesterase (5'-nucleotidase family)